ncbi:hypothetical protein IWQ57_001814 [Coemansia nantahalensis]|uniref:Uncharacterized protein n=1 Tax=Coemansia nantahalensis TaxID=2789366 RepID=A0ACC1K2K7_9FUNG|nr:hypothetical protein IWQ57_001814 [Coemansia nantahalensis]
MGPTRGPVIPAALARALSDRLYDKQRAATQKVEQMVRAALEADDDETIYALVAELATEFATSEREAARIGGLVALAATAVALTHINIRPFLAHMVPPMVSALSDGESKVRYFACESLYNVAKVSQGHILRWFNDIFDGLARVTADSVKSVKEGADYLDRLIKDIVAEQAATCLDWYSPADGAGAADGDSEGEGAKGDGREGGAEADGAEREGPQLAFALEAFVPLLAERLHTYKPSTRLYLIEWIRVLDSVPGLDLIVYLPEFLDGLLRFLSDPSDDVRTKTQSLLGELLGELRECVEVRDTDSDAGSWHGGSTDGDAWSDRQARVRSSTVHSAVHAEGRFAEDGQALSPPAPRTSARAAPTASAAATAAALGVLDGQRSQAGRQWDNRSTASLASGPPHGVSDELRMAARRKRIRAARAGNAVQPGANVEIDFARCVAILVPHIESNDQEIQLTALSWVAQLSWLCPDVIVAAVPALVNAVLPAVSHPMPGHRRTAEELHERLYGLVKDSPDPARRHRQVHVPRAEATAVPLPPPPQQQQTRQRLSFVDRARPLTPVTSITTTTAASGANHHRPLSPSEGGDALNGRSRTGSLLQTSVDSGPASAVPSIAATGRSESPEAVAIVTVGEPEGEPEAAEEDALDEAGEGPDDLVVDEAFNYDQAATAIMELFAKNVHEPTKVAGMHWLLLLHRKAPWRILTPDDMSFPVLLKMLGDSSEHVVKLDLELFAQISQHAQGRDSPATAAAAAAAGYSVDPRDVPYLARFLGSLLQMFATDRALLETRAALMVRQLCIVLDPQLVFGLFAKLLVLPCYTPAAGPAEPPWSDADDDDSSSSSNGVFSVAEDPPLDLEFVSVMVQHLSWILVTAPEAEPLRTVLRRYSPAVALATPPLPALRQALHGVAQGPGPLIARPPATRGRASSAAGRGGSTFDGRLARPPSRLPGHARGPVPVTGIVPRPTPPPRAGVAAVAPRGRNGATDGERARAKADASTRSGAGLRRPGEMTEQQHGQQRVERAREALHGAVEHVERRVAQNQQSHELFATLFRTWSHNPAACLTLCLQSQHYEMAAALVGIFGQLAPDLTVSFLVQLDKLVQLIESPLFAYLRLQLLDPQYHPMLVRALYGLLMLLPQSSAFAVLRNRLSSISPMAFAAPQLPTARPWSPAAAVASDPSDARQLHYHYHYHSHAAAAASASSQAVSLQADPAHQRAGAQMAAALGVPPSELAELARQLTACSQTPAVAFLGASDDEAADVAALLRELADLHLVAAHTDDGPAPDTADAAPTAAAAAADADLLSEYRAVRRHHHALALQRAA